MDQKFIKNRPKTGNNQSSKKLTMTCLKRLTSTKIDPKDLRIYHRPWKSISQNWKYRLKLSEIGVGEVLEKWDMKVINNYINAFLIVTVGLWLSVTCDIQVSGPRRFASVVGKLNWRRTDGRTIREERRSNSRKSLRSIEKRSHHGIWYTIWE